MFGSPVVAPLLPKLRGQFAEFLNHSSPARLSMLYLTTCVGFGYGPCTHSLEAFLGSTGSPTSPTKGYASRLTHMTTGFDQCCRATRLHRNPISGSATSLRHPITDLQRIRPHASPPTNHSKSGQRQQIRVVSLTASILGAHIRVREYQPVNHRLRLSASP